MRVPAGVKKEIAAGLSTAEALGVGEGKVDLGVMANYQDGRAMIGGYADYEHRLSDSISAFARAEAGRIFQPGTDTNFASAIGGVRFRF